MKKRNVHLYLSDQKFAELHQKAEKTGLSLSQYVYALIAKTPIKAQPPVDYFHVNETLRTINQNLSRIATAAYELGDTDKSEYRRNVERLEEEIASLMRAVV